jgi:hypothetical protein
MKLASTLKGFDIHTKTLDGVTQQTVVGAVVTVIAAITVMVLLVSEIRIYGTTDLVSRMYPDNGIGKSGETVRLFFDVEFPYVDCGIITFQQEVTRGSVHVHEADNEAEIQREQMINPDKQGKFGCWIHGSLLTDRVGGHFTFKVTPTERRLTEEERRKERDDAVSSPQMIAGAPLMKTVVPSLDHKINHIMFLPASGPGSDKKEALAANNQRAERSKMNNKKKNGDASVRSLLSSHSNIGFDLEKTLLNLSVDVEPNVGLQQYMLQVVPTHYRSRKGRRHDQHLNQYSVTQRTLETLIISSGGAVQLNGHSYADTYGLSFAYDFYPVMLTVEERKESFLEFLANLVGIIGGVITIINLVGKTVSSGVKTIMGKND